MRCIMFSFVKKLQDLRCKLYFIDYFILLIIAIIPFWNTGFSGIWNKTDLDFPIYPVEVFQNNLFLWDHSFFTGWDITSSSQLIELDRSFILAIFSAIGLPPGIVERLFFVLVFATMAFGMYYLILNISRSNNIGATRLAGIFAAFFYIFNPLVISRLYYGNLPYLEAMAVLPLTFVFLHKSLKQAQKGLSTRKYVVLTGLTSIILLSSNHPTSLLVIILLVMYWIGWLLKGLVLDEKDKLKGYVTTGIRILGVVVLLNLWWLLPVLVGIFDQSLINPRLNTDLSYIVHQLNSETNLVNTLSTFRIQVLGDIPLFVPQYWSEWINSTTMHIIGIGLFIVTLVPLLLNPKNKLIIFFTLVQIFAISALLGQRTIIGQLWFWLATNNSIFAILTSFSKAGAIMALSFSILIGFFSVKLIERIDIGTLKPRFTIKRKIILIVVFSLLASSIAINAMPLFTGNLDNMLTPLDIPQEYYDARDWFAQDPGEYRILFLPQVEFLQKYSWFTHYDMVDISMGIMPQPVISDRPGWVGVISEQTGKLDHIVTMQTITRLLVNGETTHSGKLLQLFNIKYVVVRADIITESEIDVSNIMDRLSSQKDIHLVQNFGNLIIYENQAYNPNSLIYGGTKMIIGEGFNSLSNMLKIIDAETSFDASNAFFFNDFLSDKEREMIYSLNSTAKLEQSSKIIPLNNDTVKGDLANITFTDNSTILVKSSAREGVFSTVLFNLSDYKVAIVTFWFKINNGTSNTIELIIEDKKGGFRVWNILSDMEEPKIWNKLEIPLNDRFLNDVDFDKDDVSGMFIRSLEPRDGDREKIEFSVRNLSIGIIKHTNEELPQKSKVSWNIVNPVKYEVTVDANEPILLVFSETYSNGWNARVEGKLLEPMQLRTNGYANGWYINETGITNIIIEYEPHKYYFAGQIVFIVTIIGIALVMVDFSALLNRISRNNNNGIS